MFVVVVTVDVSAFVPVIAFATIHLSFLLFVIYVKLGIRIVSLFLLGMFPEIPRVFIFGKIFTPRFPYFLTTLMPLFLLIL